MMQQEPPICKLEDCNNKVKLSTVIGWNKYCCRSHASTGSITGRKLSDDHKKKIAINSKKSWVEGKMNTPDITEKRSKSMSKTNNKNWQQNSYREKMMTMLTDPLLVKKMSEDLSNRHLEGRMKTTFNISIVNGLSCQGSYEKWFIETLVKNNIILPTKPCAIKTPTGVYTPDFEYSHLYIEIKSTYTLTTKKFEFQEPKIKWVNENIKPVIIINRNNFTEESIIVLLKSLNIC